MITMTTTMLRLKLVKRVSWAEDVVDNEKKGRKKSKVCCIYKGGDDKTKNKYER